MIIGWSYMSDCIFCKIINGDIPSTVVYEDEIIIAIKDIQPKAPIHVLVMPKVHIASLNEVDADNIDVITDLIMKLPKIAKTLGIDETGYQIVNNIGKDGGQTVEHIHFHLLGGAILSMPSAVCGI